MLRIFGDELLNPKNFVVTLELVPGRESRGRNTDTLKGIARDGFFTGCAISPFKATEAESHTLAKDFVPPRMWELNNTSSWINFHRGKDHQKKK